MKTEERDKDFESKINNMRNLSSKILRMDIEINSEELGIKAMRRKIERREEKMGGMIIRKEAMDKRLLELEENNGQEK